MDSENQSLKSQKISQKKAVTTKTTLSQLSAHKDCRITRRMKKIEQKYGKNSDKKCAICLTELEREIAILPCDHAFCMDCILAWWSSKASCPFCRKQFQQISDYSGKKYRLEDFPKKNIPKQQKTLKCQDCWADIGNENMRICIDCRCVYLHQRCLTRQESHVYNWRCQQCCQKKQKQFLKVKKIPDQSYRATIKATTQSIINYHSRKCINVKKQKENSEQSDNLP